MKTSLLKLILALEKGVKTKISVVFVNGNGFNELQLPHEKTIHSSNICSYFKSTPCEYEKCFKHRNLSINRVVTTKEESFSICHNGIYEYLRPVVIDNKVFCVICIYNVATKKSAQILTSNKIESQLLESLDYNFTEEDCKSYADVIEDYVRLIVENKVEDKNIRQNSLIKDICDYIDNNLFYDLNVQHLNQIYHYNEKYFGRLFKNHTGTTINDYVNDRRIKKAKQLLTQTNLSIIQIANSVGYNNVTYFNKVFKRIEQLTPTEFRKQTK